ncbi:GNAT family N-acetyltransferase [Euzebya rosea]|uniref:GNAT family N-acetyltransferase n=1 Tax=Euzebya rosea TaxID=2052804 RepID=UPI000D3E4278|nr:GNAT family N-acetyltransferase [Euzebya rosea]
MVPLTLVERSFDQLDAASLLAVLRLRIDVFVVEQACAYPEVDGRDDEPGTRHVWLAGDDGRIASYLRLLDDGDVQRIGRVVTAAWARGQGLAGRLLVEVLRRHPGETVLDAQSHLTGFYAAHGFAPDGPEFVEDGIPHVPMRRPAT